MAPIEASTSLTATCNASTQVDLGRISGNTNFVDEWSEIVLDSNNFPVVVWHDADGNDLEYSHCKSLDCFSIARDRVTLDFNNAGHYNSVALGLDGVARTGPRRL